MAERAVPSLRATPQPVEPDWIDDGVEHWETAGFWIERDATGRDGTTWRLNGDVVSRWVVERFRDALNAALSTGSDRVGDQDVPAMLAEFHQTFGQPFGHGDIGDSRLRIALHLEENRELIEALLAGDLTATAHELADVVYVAYGTAHSLAIPLDEVIREVHRANMSKIGPNGPEFREDGKLLKPQTFQPADVGAVLAAPQHAVPDGHETVGTPWDPNRAPCPHCPDEHRDPRDVPWGVRVADERDHDGQPTYLRVERTQGSHIAQSDADWLWNLIRTVSQPAVPEGEDDDRG